MTGRKRGRAERRERAREHERLVQELERLARLEPGGSPERPLSIDSAAIVDVRAEANPCPLCGGSLKLEEHSADVVNGVRLRIAAVACTLCGTRRSIYFRLDEPIVH